MNLDHARFAAFLSARLCHDIVSPAATMSLSLEMLDSPGSAEEKEHSERTLREGAHGVTATLQFLRYAFGSMGLQPGTADVHQFKKLTDDYLRFQKPSIEWDLGTPELNFSEARLIMNLIMVCLTATVRGGVIHVNVREENGQKTLTLTCKGDRLKLKEDVVKALKGEEPEHGWRPENIQPLFAKLTCDGLGGTLHARQAPDGTVVFMATGIKPQS
ncbi:histidine phosphotransferase family protein [Hyphomonas sp.]|uniref:histidine phosphotransferase family protein n=1 Tax=Hyphomonas sp. TaxID=87 RepID=UPI001BCB8B2F|nr:histidine phosphotransferase family protein [Hyphomonas sp.]